MVVVGDLVQLKKVFPIVSLLFKSITTSLSQLCSPSFPVLFLEAIRHQALFLLVLLVSLVKVLSIRDSLPHLRSIVLYGEEEVPSDVKVNFVICLQFSVFIT